MKSPFRFTLRRIAPVAVPARPPEPGRGPGWRNAWCSDHADRPTGWWRGL